MCRPDAMRMLSCMTRAALVLLALACHGCAPGPTGGGQGRGVLVIAIDGLRADHLGQVGYDRETTPMIDVFAQLGVAFTNAFSTSPRAMPAHVSLLTGCDPYVARRILPPGIESSALASWHVPDPAPRLAQEYLRNGFATAVFSDEPWLSTGRSFSAGFQTLGVPSEGARVPVDPERMGVLARFEQWVRQLPRERDWFAYVHVNDLARVWRQGDPLWDTYFPPRPGWSAVPPVGDGPRLYHAVPRDRWSGGLYTLGEYECEYDGAIRKLDHLVGRMLAQLRSMDRLTGTTIALVGTHGMGFGEAGLILDHGTLSDVDLHVPLLLKPSSRAQFSAGLRTGELASLCDLAPTLLELDGIRPPPGMQGVSLASALQGGPSARRHAFARGGYQDGVVVMDARWCLEYTLPWRVSDPALLLSWYGTTEVEPGYHRLVLHDRSVPGGAGHAQSAQAPAEQLAALRAAAVRWVTSSERVRRTWQRDDWGVLERASPLEDELPLGPLLAEGAGGQDPDAGRR